MLADYEWKKVNIYYQQLIVMELGFEIEEKYYSLWNNTYGSVFDYLIIGRGILFGLQTI